jgi:hypothetical protein
MTLKSCPGLEQTLNIRTWIPTSYVMVFYIFNVCSRLGHDFNVICHGLLYIQCLFQARTLISTSYVMVFYIFNVCSKPGHWFQRHMSWSDVEIHVLAWSRHWIYKGPWHMTLKSMSWLRTDIEYIKDHDIWRWNLSVPSQDMDFNVICHGLLYIQCLF